MATINESIAFTADTSQAQAAVTALNVTVRDSRRSGEEAAKGYSTAAVAAGRLENGLRGLGKIAKEAGLKGTVAEDAAGLTEELIGLATTFPAVGFGAIAAGAGVLAYAKAASQAAEMSVKLEKGLRASREAYAAFLEKQRGDPTGNNLIEGQRQDYDRIARERDAVRAEVRRLETQRREQVEAAQAADSMLRGLPGAAGQRFRDNARTASRALQETDDALAAERAKLATLTAQGERIARNTAYYAEQNRRRFEGEEALAEATRRREAAQRAADQAAAARLRELAALQAAVTKYVTDPARAAALARDAERTGLSVESLRELASLQQEIARFQRLGGADAEAQVAALREREESLRRQLALEKERIAAAQRANEAFAVTDRRAAFAGEQNAALARLNNPNQGQIFQQLNRQNDPLSANGQSFDNLQQVMAELDPLGEAFGRVTARQEAAAQVAARYSAAQLATVEANRAAEFSVNSLTGGFGALGAGIISSLDAAVQGQMSFGQAMTQVTRQVLLNIAQQAAAESAMSFARALLYAAILSPGQAAASAAAGAAFAGVAAAFGGAGLAIPGNRTAASANTRSATERPLSGNASNAAPQAVTVKVVLRDGLLDGAGIAQAFVGGQDQAEKLTRTA